MAESQWTRRKFLEPSSIVASGLIAGAGGAEPDGDLRSELDVATAPWVIPGALRVSAKGLAERHQEIPRDREVVVYCS
jgi:hypothetical protein